MKEALIEKARVHEELRTMKAHGELAEQWGKQGSINYPLGRDQTMPIDGNL